jgi:hypothetical protein
VSLSPTQSTDLRKRVIAKLEREPVEDLRIDFEDGYGVRPDDGGGRARRRRRHRLEQGRRDGTLPPFIGIRLKPSPGRPRGVRSARWSGWGRS